jgi:hypothetical protein
VKYVWGIIIPEVLRDHVRFAFNRTEGKQEIVVLKEYESVRMVSEPLLLKLCDCKWAIEVSFETKSSSPPLRAI